MRFERGERRPGDLRQWLVGAAAFLLIGGGLFALQLCGVKVCLFHRLTGFPCLTCGSSRAAALLAGGHPWQAFCMQPLAVTLGAVLGLWMITSAFHLVVLRQRFAVRFGERESLAAWAMFALLAALNWAYLVWHGV